MTAPISHEFLVLQDILAGRYSIERELGRGGMGIVLLARDVADCRDQLADARCGYSEASRIHFSNFRNRTDTADELHHQHQWRRASDSA